MYNIAFGKSDLSVPTIAVGCMRINNTDKKNAEAFLALDEKTFKQLVKEIYI